MNTKLNIYLLLFLLSLPAAYSQKDTNKTAVGGFVHYSIYFHSADFVELHGVPNCCPSFGNTTGNGFSLGAFYELPIAGEIVLNLRGNLSFINANFTANEHSTVKIGNSPVDAIINHELNAGVTQISIEPLAKYSIIKNFNLIAGISFGIGITGSYDQKEILAEPSHGTFENGLRTRNIRSSSISGISFFVPSYVIGASYDLPLNKEGNIKLSPEVLFNLGISNLISDVDWKTNALRLGVSVKYDLYSPPVIIPVEYRDNYNIDTVTRQSDDVSTAFVSQGIQESRLDTIVTEEKKIIIKNISRIDTLFKPIVYSINPEITAVPTDGTRDYPDTSLIVEEMAILSFVPVLNYIFFDDNSSAIHKRYKLLKPDEAERFFSESISQSGTLEVYYNVLNIIGRRLRDYPGANLKITGCNSNTGSEKGNKTLSKSRAEAVADYLINNWIINPSRIKIETNNLPDNASSIESPEGIEENRRVELSCDNPEVLMPIISSDTVRAVFPGIIKFSCRAGMADKISEWAINASVNGNVVKEIIGKGKLPDSVNWNINSEKNTIPESDGDIVYFLEVKDSKGISYRSRMGVIPQQRFFLRKHLGSKVIDKKVENFSLILFEFDTKRTNATNRRILDFIKSRLDKDSKVIIEGYTDNLGSEEYNKKLSEDRARSVSKYIDIKDATVKGFGNTSPFYDNKLPEGRFYNRTVIIIVETPIVKGDE
jgi:outer membrane protein OmpA-like peptidoglycan-associated protein